MYIVSSFRSGECIVLCVDFTRFHRHDYIWISYRDYIVTGYLYKKHCKQSERSFEHRIEIIPERTVARS